jgi:hypothetical protein
MLRLDSWWRWSGIRAERNGRRPYGRGRPIGGNLTLGRRVGLLVLGAAILALAVCGVVMARSSKDAASRADPARRSIPSEWVSETTKSVYRIQISASSFTAVWTHLPASMQHHGAYVRTECHHVGSKWIGTTRSYLPFSCGAEKNGREPPVRWCHIVTRTEILSIAPDRIEGRGEALKAFDCDHCRILQKEWKPFVWAPAAAK